MSIEHSELLGQEIRNMFQFSRLPKEVQESSAKHEIKNTFEINMELGTMATARAKIIRCLKCDQVFVSPDSRNSRTCTKSHGSNSRSGLEDSDDL